MGASCTVQGWDPIREDDVITKVRYEKPQVKKKQYCRYCCHCFEGDGYCCSDPPEGKDGYLSDDAIRRPNHCNNFCETEDIITGRKYKPRNAAIAEKKSENAKNDDVQLTFF